MNDAYPDLTTAQLITVRDACLAGGYAASAAIFTSAINARRVKLAGAGTVACLVLWYLVK